MTRVLTTIQTPSDPVATLLGLLGVALGSVGANV